MDVKVGNDIKLNVALPEYINPSSVLRITAVFNNRDRSKHSHHYFYNPSRYTLHSCQHHCYNVCPHNIVYCLHECNACHDHKDHKHRNRVIMVKPTDKLIFNIYFDGTHDYYLGEYELVVNIQAYERGWNCDNVHEYTIFYGHVFSISDKDDAQEGNIVIDVNKD